jgi:microcystin degradation protein MlrC
MGDCAVIRAGLVSLLILGNSVMTVDPAMYRAVGLEPADAGIIVVKSHIQFRAGYADIAREIILLDSPGMSSDRLDSLPFTRVERPLFPLDRAVSFMPQPVSRSAASVPA